MNAYFARPAKLPVGDDDLRELWNANLVAAYLPDENDAELDRGGDRNKQRKRTKRAFSALSEKGGYVWVESPVGESAKVGRVEPGTEPEEFEAVLRIPSVPRTEGAEGRATKLKTLPLTHAREIAVNEAMDLRSLRRPAGALDRWDGCGPRLAALIEGRPMEHTWGNLRPELRLAACAEYLRHHENPLYPRLARLLLPVADRDPGRSVGGPYHVDIYGVTDDDGEIFAQVPLHDDNMKYNVRMGRKVEALKEQAGRGSLVCFWDFRSALVGHTPHRDPEPSEHDGVRFVTVEEVIRWIEDRPGYAERLFSA